MPRNQSSWNEHETRIEDARALAEFLDLEPFGLPQFRLKHPDFFPPLAWQASYFEPESESGRSADWLRRRNQLRDVWTKGFPEEQVLEVISSSHLFLEFASAHEAETSPASTNTSLDTYRKAILFLYGESWRAKICAHCGRHFIADHSQSKCCSVLCSAVWRKQYKAERHKRVKKRLNEKRRREYAGRRGA